MIVKVGFAVAKASMMLASSSTWRVSRKAYSSMSAGVIMSCRVVNASVIGRPAATSDSAVRAKLSRRFCRTSAISPPTPSPFGGIMSVKSAAVICVC